MNTSTHKKSFTISHAVVVRTGGATLVQKPLMLFYHLDAPDHYLMSTKCSVLIVNIKPLLN